MVGPICYAETADVFPGITARNRAVLEYERFVHRTFHPFVIHPYSRFRVYWEIAFLFIIPFRLILATTLWVFTLPRSITYTVILTGFQVLNMVDVVLGFFTGYVESKTEIVILDKKKIAKNYLLRGFIFDVIPCVPAYVVVYLKYVQHAVLWKEREDVCTIFFVTNYFLLFRGVSFFVYLYHTSILFRWYPFLLGLICTPFIVFLLFLLLTNWLHILFFSSLEREDFETLEILSSEDRLLLLFTLIEMIIDYLNNSSCDRYFDFFVRFSFLIVTFFCTIFFLVYLTLFILLKMRREEKFMDLESRIMSFAKKRHLSSSLRQKILLYFVILLENKYCKEDEIFHYIPNTFRAEIFFHLCLPLLKNFYAFENLPTYVLRRLAESMTYQLYLPNELVMARKEAVLCMYFIQRGTLALYSSNHVELYHFEAGSSINGKNFVLGEPNTAHYAISIEVTEVYRLDYENYKDIMSAYPKLLRSIMRKFQPNTSESVAFPDYSSQWN